MLPASVWSGIQSNPEWEYVGVCTDEFVTGTTTDKRSGFQRLLDKIPNGDTKKNLKDKKIISGATINKMKNNEVVTTESIDKLCEYFQCQPEEILEFIPNTQTDKQQKI